MLTAGIASTYGDAVAARKQLSGVENLAEGVKTEAHCAALPVLLRFKKRVDHRQYNGAALLGLKSLVIKSHGSADAYAFEWAIKRGYDAVKNGVLERLARAMDENAGSLERASDTPGEPGSSQSGGPLAGEAPPGSASSSKA